MRDLIQIDTPCIIFARIDSVTRLFSDGYLRKKSKPYALPEASRVEQERDYLSKVKNLCETSTVQFNTAY
jgi:hypothetical protein